MRNNTGRFLRKLHRYGGLVSAVLVIIICTTGILLNHTDDLALDKQTVRAGWLLDWYGIELPEPLTFAHAGFTTTQLDRLLYAGSGPVPGSYDKLRGVVRTSDGVVIATSSQLAVLDKDGTYIETLDGLYGVPAEIRRIGITANNRIALESRDSLLTADALLDEWRPDDNVVVVWSEPAQLSAAKLETISRHFRGNGLTLERVILDIHAGRVFGAAGRWLADAAAIIFILLALTGIWMWARTRRRKA